MKLIPGLLLCVLLTGCQTMTPAPPPVPAAVKWTAYVTELEQMEPGQLQEARKLAMDDYLANPDDWNRMRAGYALSRAGASREQLSRSREILAEIADNSELAPMRDLLRKEVQRAQELRVSQARSQEFQNKLRELETELKELRLKLEALMEIERKMAESQENSDDLQR